jgi:hypothetical protein
VRSQKRKVKREKEVEKRKIDKKIGRQFHLTADLHFREAYWVNAKEDIIFVKTADSAAELKAGGGVG